MDTILIASGVAPSRQGKRIKKSEVILSKRREGGGGAARCRRIP